MSQLNILFIVSCIIALTSIDVFAQETKKPIEEMTSEEIMGLSVDELLEMDMEQLVYISKKLGTSIDELLKMKTSITSKNELTPRESPGIITIVTSEEITRSGARDLMDVLYMVPGINFAYDADGVVGIQMRGNWAFEGKVSVLIDGQEINDLKYYVVPFGHHLSVDQIQRVEVIRGPGSSIYGGTAELGVINIITKSGVDINGIEAIASYGSVPGASGNIRAAVNIGEKRDDFTYSVTGSLIDGIRSDRSYHADSGLYVSLVDTGAELVSKNLNLGFSYKDLSIKAIYDNYLTKYLWDDALYPNEFKSWMGELKYDWKIGEKLVLTPKFNFRRSIPYFEEEYEGNLDIRRNEFGISGNYTFKGGSSIITGANYYRDKAICMEETEYSYIYFKEDSGYNLSFSNISAFAQAFIKVKKFNFIVGGRIDNHSEYGAAFALRFGVTGIFNKFHFKLLESRAYRSPSFGNIVFEPEIEPEYTWVSEIETGYRLNDNMFITCNFFYSKIENSIVWYDSTEYNEDSYGYINGGKTGTYGLEFEYRALYTKGSATLNYSYYSTENINEIENYSDYKNSSMLIGSPQHKITFKGSYNLTKSSWVSPSIICWSGANSYGSFNSDEIDQGFTWFDPVLIANIFYSIQFKNALEISIGVKDIFNSHKSYIQGYAGYEAPFPAASREYILKVAYKFSSNK